MRLDEMFGKHDRNTLSEELQYIQNYWKPKKGQTIYFDNNSTAIIEYIDEKYPEQVKLQDLDRIAYLQEYSWKPTIEEMDQILVDFGLKVSHTCIRLNKLFFPKPDDVEGYVDLLKSARFHLQCQGIDPLSNYFN